MAANNLTFEQSAAFLNDLYQQATGQTALAVTDTASFTTVAQTVLKTGYDNVINAISQVLSRTIFSIRPYTAKFSGIMVDNQRYGDWVRKINYIDKPVVNEESYPLTDGQSYDPWVIRKPEILQTNFYGGQRYEDYVTMFTWQLDVAFSGPDEFSRWAAGEFQNIEDKLQQFREAEARSTLINFIAGKNANDSANVINVLQEYYNETGTTLTPANMYADGNYVPFTKWLYSYVNRMTQLMSERSAKFHINVTGKPVMRHTPADRLKAYMSARAMTAINSIALPSVYGADRLRMIDWESVNYWQAIDTPESIIATPTVLKTDGTLETAAQQSIDNIIGVLFDEEALGLTFINEIMAASPLNPRTLSTNYYWHYVSRTYNDFTENGIVLTAGTVTP